MGRKADLGIHMRLLGEALARAREARGLSIEALCQDCGITGTVLEQVERGASVPRGFGLNELCRLAAALRLSPEKFFEGYEAAINPRDAWWRGNTTPERNES